VLVRFKGRLFRRSHPALRELVREAEPSLSTESLGMAAWRLAVEYWTGRPWHGFVVNRILGGEFTKVITDRPGKGTTGRGAFAAGDRAGYEPLHQHGGADGSVLGAVLLPLR